MSDFLPKVTIMIPTYNSAEYIEQAVDSAARQDYENIEIVISDDNSKDNTEEIVNRYKQTHPDKNIRYIKNNANIGRVGNYHKTLYHYSTGDFVINLDGDDYFIYDSYISEAVALIRRNRDLKLVFAKQVVYYENEKRFLYDEDELPEIIDGNELFVKRYKALTHLSVLYKRDEAMKLGFYTSDIISSDWESLLKMLINNKIGFINKSIGIWRKHTNNASLDVNIESLIHNIKFITASYEYAKNNGIDLTKLNAWRDKMLEISIIRDIIILTFADRKKLHEYMNNLKKKFPDCHKFITKNYNYYGVRFLGICKPLLYWVLKNILKAKLVIEDINSLK